MRNSILLIVLALLLTSGLAAAQELPPVPCGDLSEEDCAILTQAQQASMQLNSGTVDLTLDLNVANVPDMPGSLTLAIAGTGAFSGDLSAFYDQSLTMMGTNFTGNPQQSMELLSSFLENFNGDLTLNITLPEELLSQMNTGEQEVPNPIVIGLRLVDGIGYINLDQLADLGVPGGWRGINLVEALDAMSQQMAGMMDEGAAGVDPETMAQFQDPEFLNQYLDIQRLEDSTAPNGTAVAVFQTTLDFAGMMSDPMMQDMLMEQMQSQMEASGAGEMTDEQLQQMSQMMGQMYEGFNIVVTQHIGLEDFNTYRTEMNFDWDMTSLMSATMGATGSMATPEAGGDMSAPMISLALVVNTDNFNTSPEITAPEDAVIVPLSELGMGMGMGGGMGDDMGMDGMATEDAMGAEMMPTATP